MRRLALLSIAFASLLAVPAVAQDWKPSKRVEVVVGVAPGGAMDRTARFIDEGLKRSGFLPPASTVQNKPGGAHAVALSYTASKKGDPLYIQIVNTPIVANKLLGRSPLSFEDVSPLALLFDEKMLFAVHPSSKLKTPADLIAALKADPASLSFSVSSGIGTANHFAVMLLAQAVNVDPIKLKTVSFGSAAEGITATLGNHVDVVVTTPSALAPFAEAKQLRMIAVASDKRLPAPLSDVPTWKEAGADIKVGAWRGVVAPPGIKPAEIQGWEKALAQIIRSAEFEKEAKQEFLEPNFLGAADTAAFFRSENQRYGSVLKALGVMK